jgi:uncharacterized protein YjbJ (UPF0337 family)
MSNKDKIKNWAQGAKGKLKEAAGAVGGHRRTAHSGQNDQLKAHAKNAGEHAKDVGKDLRNASQD